jgi:hypothetical protein
LVKLPKASCLRALAPKHRPHAPHAHAALAQQSIGNDCAHDAGGCLRPQGDVIFALIDEAEHLLLDDVREIADRALEQLRLLDHRHAKFFVAVTCENLARHAFQVLPGRDLRGQHIVHAAQGLDDLAQELSPISRADAGCVAAHRAFDRGARARSANRAVVHHPRRPRSEPHHRQKIAVRLPRRDR